MKKWRRGLFLSPVVLSIVAGTIAFSSCDRSGLPEGAFLPEFVLNDHRAKPFDSTDLWGKVVVIVFWKLSAEASVAEIKGLDLLWNKYRESGFEAVGISLDEGNVNYIKGFVSRHRVKMPLLVGDVETAHLFGGLKGIPTIFIFDREGKVREVFEGFQGEDTLEEKILELL
jgi:peroxiredoxin